MGEKVLGDAVFYSAQAAMNHSPAFDRFASVFDTRYGTPPDRLAALGYDAVNIMAAAVREGRQGPGDIAAYLKLLNGYQGASGKISFGTNRSNLELSLFTFREGLVKPLVEQPVMEAPAEELHPDSVKVEVIKYGW